MTSKHDSLGFTMLELVLALLISSLVMGILSVAYHAGNRCVNLPLLAMVYDGLQVGTIAGDEHADPNSLRRMYCGNMRGTGIRQARRTPRPHRTSQFLR